MEEARRRKVEEAARRRIEEIERAHHQAKQDEIAARLLDEERERQRRAQDDTRRLERAIVERARRGGGIAKRRNRSRRRTSRAIAAHYSPARRARVWRSWESGTLSASRWLLLQSRDKRKWPTECRGLESLPGFAHVEAQLLGSLRQVVRQRLVGAAGCSMWVGSRTCRAALAARHLG